MKFMKAHRWGDNDYYFGPLTFSKDLSYRSTAIILSSGGEDFPGASFRISMFGRTIILALPQWMLQPHREKIKATYWDEKTIKRFGRNWYWGITPREYGFYISEGFFSVSFGKQTHDSSTEMRWGYFFPWTEWRHVRHSYYGLNGEHVATLPKGKSYKEDPGRWEREQKIKKSVPTVSFEFDDYDGERIIATSLIEEREWHFGAGWFKWLSMFKSPKISRSLDLRFSSEVGDRKGSWKGGTVGHSIEMLPGELHEDAFKRYCDENNLVFVKRRED